MLYLDLKYIKDRLKKTDRCEQFIMQKFVKIDVFTTEVTQNT